MKKKIRVKKKVVVVFLILLFISFSFGFYGFSLKRISKTSEEVTFVVKSGTSKRQIATQLKEAGLVRSQYALLLYLFFNSDLNLQAGTYLLNRNMDAPLILEKIHKGDIYINTVTFTFVEGKTISDLARILASKFPYTETEIKETLNNKEFVAQMIEKYDFLTDEVLNGNIYYALEGYLYPDTYEVMETASIEEIIDKMLFNTKTKLASVDLSKLNFTIHEILTMASIVELEGAKESDRPIFAQVIYKRLESGMTLGMDTTTYYAARKSRNEGLTMQDLNLISPYNTRGNNSSMSGKLPVGPIGNPSLNAIEAVLNPSDTDYIYFVANTCTGETFFNTEYEAHRKKSIELQSICATN